MRTHVDYACGIERWKVALGGDLTTETPRRFFSNLIFYFPCSRGRAKAHKQHSALMQHAHTLHSRQVFVFNNALSTERSAENV